MANRNLTAAKNAKNDEFYTRLEDIQKELYNYPNAFIDKIVYLNCDDGEWSNFWRYFYQRFHSLKLKKLIATSYKKDGGTYKYEFEGNGTDYVNYMEGVTKTLLEGDGDFRSDECIEILKQADIVVTNPPFSLFREYIAQLIEYEKKFIVLGNPNAITYKEFFPLIKDNKVWIGFKSMGTDGLFHVTPEHEAELRATKQEGSGWRIVDGIFCARAAAIWYTNIEHSKRHHITEFYGQYSEEEYPRYDNYDAIDVNRVSNIPCNWTKEMGVPITWLDKFCPEQFEIIGMMSGSKDPVFINGNDGRAKFYVNGVGTYARIVIRWKPEAMPQIINGVPVYKR